VGGRVAVIAATGAVVFAASGVPADAAPVAEATGAAQFAVAEVAEEATSTAGLSGQNGISGDRKNSVT
jgi:hypothetical protein